MKLARNITLSSQLEPDASAFSVSDARVVASLQEAEDSHFWHLTRNRLIQRNMKRLGVTSGAAVLELGCGSGAVAASLASIGYQVVGIDGHLTLIQRAAHRAPSARFIVHDLTLGIPPTQPNDFDAVCFFDVLEHVKDPKQVLEDAGRRVRPRGFLIGTVPALMFLWSRVDELSGHQLRYSRKVLTNLLQHIPGFTLVEIRDFNRHLVPLLWLQRRVISWRSPRDDSSAHLGEDNLRVPPKVLNDALTWLSGIEQAVAQPLERLPIPGASLWFALRRIES